jgi:dTMP kinase
VTRFIAIEGLDASGKTTQAALLADALTARGNNVETWSFPRYDTFFGQRIKTLLEGSATTSAANLDPSSMALWFAADRWDAVHHRIQNPAVVDIVILNRWTLSNAVYQGARAGDQSTQDALFDWVLELEYERFDLPRPLINIVLEVSVDTSMQRAVERAALVDAEPDVYESSARLLHDSLRLYRRAESLFPEVHVIEVDAHTREAAHETILSAVTSALTS